MPEEIEGEIMEISGLGQAPVALSTFKPPVSPIYSDPYASTLGAVIGEGVWPAILAIGLPILAAIVVKTIIAFRELPGGGGTRGLGVIKKCRTADRTPARPARDQIWCLWDSKGKRILGRHPSKKRAIKQEQLIQLRKRGII